MLILPLHRPLTAATFPFVTAALLAFNVFIFFVLQSSDGERLAAAHEHYVGTPLAALESAAYERYLENSGRDEALRELRALPQDARAAHVGGVTLNDVAFLRQLRQGEPFAQPDDRRAWIELRARYDALLSNVFTLRHVMRSSEIDFWRMLSSAFLHGSVGHLLGNMLFLAALGLLVEGALGGWRFLGLYLLGAYGSSAFSLMWRWGEAGSGLGASGAIATLMGAFCMVWGRQPVRFFYWFGVLFDYVRAPAIWLLPVWLGWEIYNLLANPDLGIGFDAHAGGLLSGAALGALLVWAQQVRSDFVHEPELVQARDERYAQAQAHLGRMQLAEADALLIQLQQEQPQRFDLGLVRYRVARAGGNRIMQRERAMDLLRLRACDGDEAREQAQANRDLPDLPLPLDERIALARRWMMLSEVDAAEALLENAQSTPAQGQALAQLWFELALLRNERREAAAAQRAFDVVRTRFPDQPQARKARFLLENS